MAAQNPTRSSGESESVKSKKTDEMRSRLNHIYKEGEGLRRVGYVYFITWGEDEPVKIGWAQCPGKRLLALQTSHPYELRVEGVLPGADVDLEREIHAKFDRHRIRGEWFSRCVELNRLISEADRTWAPIIDNGPGTEYVSLHLRKCEDGGLANGRWIVWGDNAQMYFKTKNRKAAVSFIEKLDGETQEVLREARDQLVKSELWDG